MDSDTSFLTDRAKAAPRNSPWPEAAHYSKAPQASVVDVVLVGLLVVSLLALVAGLAFGGPL